MWPPPLLPGLAARWTRFSCYLFPLFLYFVFCNPVPRSHAPGPLLFIPSAESSLTIPIASRPDGSSPTGKTVIATTESATLPAATKEVERSGHPQSPSDFALAAHPSFGQQMVQKATAAIVILSSLIAYVTVNSAVRAVNPRAFVWSAEDNDEKHWIASSPSWLDRKACRWLGLCGTAHFHPAGPRFGQRGPPLADEEDDTEPWRSYWWNGTEAVEEMWDESERSRRLIPEYVFRYAPLVHLFSDEQFWPGDIAEHLYHVTPTLNYTPIQSQERHPSLEDLDELNQWQDGRPVFLTSNDNVEDRPPWMEGEKNIPRSPSGHVEQSWADWDGRVDGGHPDDTPEERAKWYDAAQLPADEDLDGMSPDALGYPQPEDILNFKDDEIVRDELRKRFGGEPIHAETSKGRSDAPAILLVMDKGNGIIDAFWFFFYSFNLGNVVLNVRFGNHIGDWEHCLVRFHNGKPKALFFSAHSAGEAYSYEAVEKIGERPVIYSAVGTHAMYATPGIHSYILPWGLLHDRTDRGPLWDPLLNSHSYTYDFDEDDLRASTATPSSPTGWFYFQGHWGDKFYPLGDQRQYRFAGQYHYVNGPVGPRFKHLNRRKVCQGPDTSPCVIKDFIGEHKRAKRWVNPDPAEYLS